MTDYTREQLAETIEEAAECAEQDRDGYLPHMPEEAEPYAESALRLRAAAAMIRREGDVDPRGGGVTNWWEEWVKAVRRLRSLENGVKLVLEEVDANLRQKKPPYKYLPPFGGLAELRTLLSQAYEPPARAALAPPKEPKDD